MTTDSNTARDIGRLLADAEENKRQRDAMFNKMDAMQKALNELCGQVKLILARHDTLVKEFEEDVKPVIADYSRLKARGLGIIAGIGLVAGTGGSFLSKWWGA
jgi:hypothetical protein